QLITLPKLSAQEIADLSNQLELHLDTKLGYKVAPPEFVDTLPASPKGIHGIRTMARVEDSTIHVIQFGIQRSVSQPPQCWVLGLIVNQDNTMAENPNVADIEAAIAEMMKSLDELRKGLVIRDLETKIIQLSYVDAKTALAMLKGMGITTFPKPESIPPKIDFAQLPYVISIEDPLGPDTGLIGAETKLAGGKTSLTPGTAGKITDNAVAGPMTQLMIMFHPAHPGQFSDVRSMLDTFIDRPARQIFIEGMVLEISENGLKELGVKWDLLHSSPHNATNNPVLSLQGDALQSQNLGDASLQSTLGMTIHDTSRLHNVFTGPFPWDWSATIQALVLSGKAEVLSRPSVLTLNNRQSTIRVGKDIPILSSSEGTNYNASKISFKFEYLSTGILLNIRPRINEAGTEVTMLIDTIVSARVTGEDLQITSKAPSGDVTVLAEAPTISTRRVQTYGRIKNNTPFIIGGLVAREKISAKTKVPLLGDIPIVGALFRNTKSTHEKREVIIVVTPYILPEEKLIPRSLPKDEDLFDSFGHELFRDSYRIRSEDVFDLTFLLENARILTYRSKARLAVTKNFRLGEQEPFKTFVQNSIPGEPILVTRMIYEVIKRLSLDAPVLSERIIYLESQQEAGGYNVRFIDSFLEKLTKGKFTTLGDKAVALTFHGDASQADSQLNTQSTPEVSLVDCADREAWGKLLWELNQPGEDGQSRHTVLIQDRSDIVRLRRAMALKKIITLNGGSDQMLLKNFSVGKVLLMPEMREDQTHLIDVKAAMFF
ncbi:MAG: type II secretion system protein GspD, partial [Phycisphaeraceae bacterium]|nr:type II secretion system protein GspD [Phycisphaeraceae bacterium]